MLISAFANQNNVFGAAFKVLETAIATRAFPAASIAVTHQGRLIALNAFGHFTYETESEAASLLPRSARKPALSLSKGGDFDVTPSPLFDLASLTKVVATTTMAAILYERGLLELDAPIVGPIPEFLADGCGELDPRR